MADVIGGLSGRWAEEYTDEARDLIEVLEGDCNFQKARADAAEAERDALTERLNAVTTGDWSKARLVRFENGQFDFSGGPVAYIAEYLAQLMEDGSGYHNNMEVRVSHAEAGPLVMTLQRVLGKTPAEQRKSAETALAAEKIKTDALVAAVRDLLTWDEKRGYPIPYRHRDPLLRALSAVDEVQH